MDKANVFVKIEDYKEVLEVLQLLQHKIRQARAILRKIDELRSQEDAEIDEWKAQLDDVEKKVNAVDQSLLEPEPL